MSRRYFFADTRGSTAITIAFSAPVLIAIAGAATMYAYQVTTKTQLQAALDAGALAGTALGASANDEQRLKAAYAAFEQNFNGTASMSQGQSDYAIADGSDKPKFIVARWEVSGEASATIDNPFSFIVGDKKLKVSGLAAAVKMESEPICILGLNPNHKETIDMTGQPVVTAKNCAVQANSRNGSGMNQKGKPKLTAKIIGTTGGYTGSGYSPSPITGTIPVADPYADIPFPETDPCDYHNTSFSGETATISPGVYCGGLRIKAGAQVTMEPGIYVMKDGPLWMNGTSTLYGREVMVGFSGPDATLYMEGSSALDLTSPASGIYVNMQFMQEPKTGGDDLYFSVIGNNKFSIDGALYAPTLDVWFGGGSVVNISSPGYALVADKIWTQDQTTITVSYENKRNLAIAGAVGFKYGARLIK